GQGDVTSAIEESRRAMELDPLNPHVGVFLGRMFHIQGRGKEAQECFQKVIALKPDHVQARWCSTMCALSVAYGPDESPVASREAFAHSLAELERWFLERQPANGPAGVGIMQPFYLAYHEYDNRPLLSRYGDLCARLMQHSFEAGKLTPIVRHNAKVRVG